MPEKCSTARTRAVPISFPGAVPPDETVVSRKETIGNAVTFGTPYNDVTLMYAPRLNGTATLLSEANSRDLSTGIISC